MQTKKYYCSTCKKHTVHAHHPAMYATRCVECNTYTGQVERNAIESLEYVTPDGIPSQVVEHTPDMVVFYIPAGLYAGYVRYDKHKRAFVNEIGEPLIR